MTSTILIVISVIAVVMAIGYIIDGRRKKSHKEYLARKHKKMSDVDASVKRAVSRIDEDLRRARKKRSEQQQNIDNDDFLTNPIHPLNPMNPLYHIDVSSSHASSGGTSSTGSSRSSSDDFSSSSYDSSSSSSSSSFD